MRTDLMKRTVRGLLVLVIAVLATSDTVVAKDYFVSPSGDDGADGTRVETAFATIDRAAKVARAGDVINVLPGTYVGRVRPVASGTAESPIVYRRHGDGEVVIATSVETDGGGWHERAAFRLGDGNHHTVIEGLTFRGAETWIYVGDGASHNTVRDCTFDGMRNYFHGILINNASWNRIENCRFLSAVAFPDDWDADQPLPRLADYITIWRNSHHNLIEGCQFHAISHVAVGISGHDPEFLPRFTMIRNNTFHDPRWKPMGFGAAEDVLVEGNRMYGRAGTFIQFQARRAIVRRNIMHHYRPTEAGHPPDYRGALLLRSIINEYGGLDDARLGRIYHNTFYHCARPVAYGVRPTTLPVCENIFKNNIFWKFEQPLSLPRPFFAHFTTQNANYFTGNLIASGISGAKVVELATLEDRERFTLAEISAKGRELCRRDVFADNIEAEPKLAIDNRQGEPVELAKLSAADFMPMEGSPCIDAGTPLTTTTDGGQGRIVPVEDAHYFCDGWGMIPGDFVTIGSAGTAQVVKVDIPARTLTLDRDLTWKKGEAVNLPFSGTGPDIGAVELIEK